jgi:hypothetical protein
MENCLMCPVCFSGRGMANHAWRFCARCNRRWSNNRSRQENCHKNIEDQRSAEEIPLDEGACRGCDQRIHRNPVTLVTLAVRHLICR